MKGGELHFKAQGFSPVFLVNNNMKQFKPNFVLLTAALLSAGCGHGAKPADDNSADAKLLPSVQVVPVTRGTLEKLLPAAGLLQTLPGREAIITPPVAGVLSTLSVRYGQTVTRGQVIAQMSTQPLAGQLQQAEAAIGQNKVQVQQAQANAAQQAAQTQTSILQALATLRNAEAALAGAKATLLGSDAAVENSKQTLARQQTLFGEGLVPQKDVEAAELALRTALAQQAAQQQAVAGQRQTVAGQEAAVAAARAASLQSVVKRQDILIARQQLRNSEGALTTAQSQKALYTLRTPLSGLVSAVNVTAGTAVDTTAKVAVIANLDQLQLLVSLPGSAVASVKPGQMLTFTVGSVPKRVFRTTISTISPRADAATGTVPALAVVSNTQHLLKDDTTARVQIVTERHPNVLIVPKAAVLTDADTGKPSVVLVDSGGVAHITPVTLGLTVGDRAEVLSGVKIGDKVAVSNQYGLPDGAKVSVTTGEK